MRPQTIHEQAVGAGHEACASAGCAIAERRGVFLFKRGEFELVDQRHFWIRCSLHCTAIEEDSASPAYFLFVGLPCARKGCTTRRAHHFTCQMSTALAVASAEHISTADRLLQHAIAELFPGLALIVSQSRAKAQVRLRFITHRLRALCLSV